MEESSRLLKGKNVKQLLTFGESTSSSDHLKCDTLVSHIFVLVGDMQGSDTSHTKPQPRDLTPVAEHILVRPVFRATRYV